MPWYAWVFLVVIAIETIFLIYYLIRNKSSSSIITETVSIIESKYMKFTKEQDDILNKKLYDQAVKFDLRVTQLTNDYSKKVEDVKNEQKDLYNKLLSDPSNINTWLENKLK